MYRKSTQYFTDSRVRFWPKYDPDVPDLSVCYRESCLRDELLILTSHSEVKYSIENLFYRLMAHKLFTNRNWLWAAEHECQRNADKRNKRGR